MMLRLLFLLGLGLYAVLLIGGEDRGQLRAGLRDQPPPAQPEPVLADGGMAASADTLPQAPSEAPSEAPLAATLASVPSQPIRILPAPQRAPVVEVAVAEEPVADAADEDAASALPPNTELRWVAVESANVRKSPSRQASITGRVESGEALLVLWVEDSGWARVRVEGDGIDGFVHESLLTDIDPAN